MLSTVLLLFNPISERPPNYTNLYIMYPDRTIYICLFQWGVFRLLISWLEAEILLRYYPKSTLNRYIHKSSWVPKWVHYEKSSILPKYSGEMGLMLPHFAQIKFS